MSYQKEVNRMFNDRIFYLFDTFEDFDEKDVPLEINKGYSNACKGRFSDINEGIVSKKMLYKDKCII